MSCEADWCVVNKDRGVFGVGFVGKRWEFEGKVAGGGSLFSIFTDIPLSWQLSVALASLDPGLATTWVTRADHEIMALAVR